MSAREQYAAHAVLIVAVVLLVGPVITLALSGTHDSATLGRHGPQLWPGEALSDNLDAALSVAAGPVQNVSFAQMLATSLTVAGGVALLTTALSLLAAYAIVYFPVRVAGAVLWLSLVTLMFPLEARFLPTVEVADILGLVNTRAGLILPVLPLALATLFLVQGLRTLPDELTEAAMLDGARPLRFLSDFILPLMRPRLGAVFVVSFVIGWNQYLWPLIVTLDERGFTLVRGLGLIGAQSGPGMVYILLTLLPPLALIIALRKPILGALKI